MIWLEFIFCTGLIFISGSLLSRYADTLAETTGMGHTWIGLILLATVTSLPELATGLSSVVAANVPEIAVGDVLGSCVFNLMLIGILDCFYRRGPVLSHVDQGHILSAGFGVLLIGIAGISLLLGTQQLFGGIGWFGFYSIFILILWVIMVKKVFSFEKKRMEEISQSLEEKFPDMHRKNHWIYFKVFMNAGIIIGAGIWLPFIGHRISEATGLGDTFVGNLLVAASTSLPEIVTSFAALRLGAPDLAVANLFGSNLFNMAVLAMDDLAYLHGPLLSNVSVTQMVSVFSALMMTGICVAGLIFRSSKKGLGVLSWEGFGLIIVYLLNGFILFSFSRLGIA